MSTQSGDSPKPPGQPEWDRIANGKKFAALLAAKKMFILPAFIFFLLYFVLLYVLAGYAPNLMSMRVLGTINLGYLFALSQFVVGWIIAWLYLRASAKFDSLIKDILEDSPRQRGAN
jgi:uncharacterized membrane protein (DUF485 family)